MPARMAGKMHRLGLHAAQVKHMAVTKAVCVGSGCEVELVEYLLPKTRARFAFEAIDIEQTVEACGAREIVVVDVHACIWVEPVAGQVIFVGMAVEHGVDRNSHTTTFDNRDRRVDDDRLAGSFDQHRVARRVGALFGSGQDCDMVG